MTYAKAIVAALISFLGSVQASWDGGVTGQEWLGATIVGLVALGAVFGVKNKPASSDRGAVAVGELCLIVIAVCAVIALFWGWNLNP